LDQSFSGAPVIAPESSGDRPRQLLLAILTAPVPPAWQRYGAATLLIAFVTLIWFSLQHSVTGLPFLLYMAAIFAVALIYGRGAGFLAVGLSIAALVVLFADPLFRFAVESADDLLAMVLFALIGCGIAVLADALRATVRSLQVTLDRLAGVDREKDILLREVHHRIRNDLQMVTMQLHLAKAQDGSLSQALDRTIERIGILARIYERLQRQDRARVVEAGPFLQQLVEDLKLAHVGTRPIGVHAQVEPARLSIPAALALGIVTNELVTNAFKYAFPDARAGRIDVSFRRSGDDYVLTVQDNGGGIAGEHPKGTGLGRQIIQQFAEQLYGRFEVQSGEHGVSARLAFPMREALPES